MEICRVDCPFHHMLVEEVSGVGDVFYVYCRLYKNGREPILELDDKDRIEVILEMREHNLSVGYPERFCIAPVQSGICYS